MPIGMVLSGLLIVALLYTLIVRPVHAANTNSIDLERGSAQYLSVADNSALDLSSDLTIEAWVKFEDQVAAQTIVAKSDVGGGSQRGYVFDTQGGTGDLEFVSFYDGSSVGCSVAVAASLSTGVWTHVAVTKNGTTVKFYKNGSQVGTNQTCSNGTIYNNNRPFEIGAVSADSAYSDGLIDDVRVWNFDRSSVEISDDMSRELNGNETGLVGYWKLNNSLSDSTSNGNTLTNNNSAAFSASTPFVGFAEALRVRKAASESVSSSTVLQNDDSLKLSLAANTTYIIDGVLFASSTSATPDVVIAFYGQTGSTISIGYTNDVNEMVLSSAATSSRITLPANTPTSVHLHGTIVTGSTSGDLQLKWAQATANANPTTIMAGSYLRAESL
jgi:hypothetical protein